MVPARLHAKPEPGDRHRRKRLWPMDYGPWFWPPQDPSTFVSQGQPRSCSSIAFPGVSLTCPGTPNPSGTPEAFMDTPVVNGTAYPVLHVAPAAYRFQMLNAANDRTWNLGIYVAEPLSISLTNGGSGYTSAPTVDSVQRAPRPWRLFRRGVSRASPLTISELILSRQSLPFLAAVAEAQRPSQPSTRQPER